MSTLQREEAELQFKVVVNHEQQYSIWPSVKANPPGWFDEGFAGSKGDSLLHIKDVWTDMRPLSLRRQMEADLSSSP